MRVVARGWSHHSIRTSASWSLHELHSLASSPAAPCWPSTASDLCLLQVHGACQTLVSDHRPVPLTWMYCHEVHRRAQLSLMDLSKASSTEPEAGFLQPTQLSSANRA